MSELQRLYQQFRSRGFGHRAALRSLEEATGIDAETVERQLKRAGADDARRSRNPHHSRPPRKKEAPQ